MSITSIKNIAIVLIILVIFTMIMKYLGLDKAGSYPYVEYWDIHAKESEVMEVIKELKKENPSLQPPNQIESYRHRRTGYNWQSFEMLQYKNKLKTDPTTPLPAPNDENSYKDYWLYYDFFYPDTKEIVHTWTRPETDSNVTAFALISFHFINDSTKYSLINRDFKDAENKEQISKFEKRIVNLIKMKIEERKKRSGNEVL